MPIHGRNNEPDIARYYSIPERILATAFPAEYAEYKEKMRHCKRLSKNSSPKRVVKTMRIKK